MPDLVSLLAAERPIFHSEADFQHALAWLLHQRFPHAALRLEYRPFPDERFYLDIWVDIGTERLAIELKYPTRGIQRPSVASVSRLRIMPPRTSRATTS